MKSQITIKDIARDLNISISTVSRALQGHEDISKKTIARVRAYAEEHHYRPNTIALSLKHQRTYIIGVIVPQMVHEFFSSVIAGIEDTAAEKGYSVIVCQSAENYDKEVKCIYTLSQAHVCGLIASVSKETKNFDTYKEFMDEGTPIVFYDRISPNLETDYVVVDDYCGSYQAVEHMIKKGCRRIAFYGVPQQIQISTERERGYLDALKNNNIEPDKNLIFECDDRDDAINKTTEILEKDSSIDGFFAVNYDTAAGIVIAAKRLGKKIPEEISVCGFGDGNVAKVLDPQLTTIEQNGYEMGAEACRMLLNRIESKEPTPITHKIIPTRLIVRGSTK